MFLLDLFRLSRWFFALLLKKPRILLHIFINGSRYSSKTIDVGMPLRRNQGIFSFHPFDRKTIKQIHRENKAHRNHHQHPDSPANNCTRQWKHICKNYEEEPDPKPSLPAHPCAPHTKREKNRLLRFTHSWEGAARPENLLHKICINTIPIHKPRHKPPN